MRLNTPGRWNLLGKKVAPLLARTVAKPRPTNLVEMLDAYLNCVIGKGAGTGWDQGEEIAAARVIGRRDPVVLDLGANRGEWTMALREMVGGGGRWILVDAAAECCRLLRTLPQVEVIEAAVGESPGRATFYTPGDASGIASLHARQDSVARGWSFEERDVVVTTIDEMLETRGLDHVDLIKMDLEGHELFALRGAARSLAARRIRAIAFEFGASNVNSRTFFRDFWVLLTGYGFDLHRIYPGGATVRVSEYYEDLEYFRGVTNYLAIAR